MDVRIFFPLPDPYRRSMFVVGDNLIRSLRDVASSGDRITPIHPVGDGDLGRSSRAWSRRNGLSRYYQQYLKYQVAARRRARGVCHIIDSAYAHLLFSMRAERCVVTVHDLMRYRQANGRHGARSGLHALLRQYNAAAIRRAGHVIVVSRQTFDDCVEFLSVAPEGMTVVHNGVDESFFDPREEEARRFRERFGLDDHFVLLHVGHVGFYKNIENVIRALSIAVHEKGLDAVLLKGGHRLDDSQRELARSRRIADRILEIGEVAASELPALYAAADALVFPSMHEGFGLPVLEAMACGAPVIASDIDVFHEVAGEAALFVDPRAPEDIADGISRLAADAERRRALSTLGKERARRFTWRAAAEKTYRVYSALQ